jgi:hypothetical protein
MMMLRLTLLAAAAFGVTWAAETSLRQAAESSPVVVLAQAQAPTAEAGSADTPDTTTGEPQSDMSQVKLEGPSEEEMERELERIEAAIDGEEAEDAKEFEPSKPLVADVPIDLPSDI